MSDEDSPWYSMRELMDYIAKNGIDPRSDERLRKPAAEAPVAPDARRTAGLSGRPQQFTWQMMHGAWKALMAIEGEAGEDRVADILGCDVKTVKRRASEHGGWPPRNAHS